MKLKFTTPFLMTLAVALSPAVHAEEAPQTQTQPPAAGAPTAAQEIPENHAPPEVVAGMQKQIETLAEQIEKVRSEAAAASDQRDAAHQEAVAVREAKKQIENQLGSLRKQLDASSQEVSQWKEKAGNLEKKTTVLEKKLGAGEEAYAKLGTFRDEMTNALKEFAVLKNDLATVRDELQAPVERVALKKQVAELKASRETLTLRLDAEVEAHTESKGLLAVLGRKLEEMKNSAKVQLEAFAKVQRERDELGKNLSKTSDQLKDVRQEATGLKEAKIAVEKDLTAARSELSQTQNMLATLQKDAAQLRATMEPLAAGIKEANAQASRANTAIREATAARVRAENEATQLQNKLKATDERLAEALKAQHGLQQLVHTKTTELDGLRKKVEQLEATVQASANQELDERAGL